MIRKLLLLALILGFAGCANTQVLYSPATPGVAYIDGAQVQLLFSNPNYDKDHEIEDVPIEVFGKKGGMPAVTGGLGLMSTWHF